MADHWSALAARLPPSPASSALADGARSVERMIEELEPLTATHGLHGQPAAQGLGASLGVGRSFVRDRFLERNQAVRYAVADAALVRALLGYLAAVSAASGNADLAGFSARWEGELGTLTRPRERPLQSWGQTRTARSSPWTPRPSGALRMGWARSPARPASGSTARPRSGTDPASDLQPPPAIYGCDVHRA